MDWTELSQLVTRAAKGDIIHIKEKLTGPPTNITVPSKVTLILDCPLPICKIFESEKKTTHGWWGCNAVWVDEGDIG